MLGVFDSGAGGALAVRLLRERLPRADVVFFPDRKNAPFGDKEEPALLPVIESDLESLRKVGARRILVACVTAGSLYDKLTPTARAAAFPILAPTAKRARRATKTGKIALIATAATVRAGALQRALEASGAEVLATAAPALVTLAENRQRTAEEEFSACRAALLPLGGFDFDTLVLGCTHFPLFGETFRALCPSVSVVSSTEAGVDAFVASLPDEEKEGNGKTVLLSKTDY